MATGSQFPYFPVQFLDHSGTRAFPAAQYLLYQYLAGTTTDQATYTDKALTIENEQPIILNAAGKCTMYADPDLAYTFVLKTPAGVTVDTWDSQSVGLATEGDFLPLAGGTMTGAIELPGDPQSDLEASTRQYVDAAVATAILSITALTDAATAAAAAATAAAAAVVPEVFTTATETGGATTRDITLGLGTYSVILLTGAYKIDAGGTYSVTVTQSATVGGTTVGTTFPLVRSGGAGYGRDIYGSDFAVGTLIVSTAGVHTMAMGAASLSTATSSGSMLIVAKQS